MTTVVVWNPRASRASAALLAIVQARLGACVCELGEGQDVTECAAAAIAAGPLRIVAAGGDGTVSAVAAAIVALGQGARGPALGVLPIGTSNSFAAAMGIPAEIDQALALLDAVSPRLLDVGVAETAGLRRVMILHCMVGFHAETIAQATVESKQRWGVLAYVGSALRQLTNLTPFVAEVQSDTHTIRCSAIAVGVANLAPPRAMLAQGPSRLVGDDGLLDTTIVAAETISEAVATSIHLYRSALEGEPADRDNVGSLASASVTIDAVPPQQVLLDGEPFGQTPVRIQAMPGVLPVLAPVPASDGEPRFDAPLEGLPDLEIEPVR